MKARRFKWLYCHPSNGSYVIFLVLFDPYSSIAWGMKNEDCCFARPHTTSQLRLGYKETIYVTTFMQIVHTSFMLRCLPFLRPFVARHSWALWRTQFNFAGLQLNLCICNLPTAINSTMCLFCRCIFWVELTALVWMGSRAADITRKIYRKQVSTENYIVLRTKTHFAQRWIRGGVYYLNFRSSPSVFFISLAGRTTPFVY